MEPVAASLSETRAALVRHHRRAVEPGLLALAALFAGNWVLRAYQHPAPVVLVLVVTAMAAASLVAAGSLLAYFRWRHERRILSRHGWTERTGASAVVLLPTGRVEVVLLEAERSRPDDAEIVREIVGGPPADEEGAETIEAVTPDRSDGADVTVVSLGLPRRARVLPRHRAPLWVAGDATRTVVVGLPDGSDFALARPVRPARLRARIVERVRARLASPG